MRALALAAAVAVGGCSAVLKFHECDVDSDCIGQNDAGDALQCSDDHMCVGAIPDYQLCKVSIPADGKIPSGALVIGGLFRTSGANDVNDHTFRNAADLAAQDFIDANFNVAHVVCDTAGDSDQAARAYNVVIQRFGAKIIVGPDTSDEVFAVAAEVESRGVPIISPSGTNPRITKLPDNDLVWRTAASDTLQAKVLATLPVASSKLDIIYVSDSAYAKGLKDAFISNFAGTVKELGFASGDTAMMTSMVTMASNDAPGSALLIADFDAPPLMSAVSKATGLMSTQFLMTDSAKKPSLWGQLGGSYTVMSRVRGTGPANPSFTDPSGMAFMVMQSNYKARFGGEDPAETAFVGNAYDAFYTAAFAALSLPSDKRDGASLVSRLKSMSDPAGAKVVVGQNGINDGVTTLQLGGTIDLVGTSGPIDFDAASGDIVSAPIEKWSVDISGAMPTFKTDTIVVP
jgi:ABC-type branched-subunit amino acid transport system substrate-binding protein